MADDPITPATPAAPPVTDPAPPATPGATPDPQPDPQGDEPLREPGKKALEAERTARAKAEADLAALRKEIEDSKLTAEQKTAADLAAAQQLAAENAAKALRYEIAAAHEIPLSLATRLTGTTREEIEKDAETFKTLIPGATPAPRSPAPDPSQGPRHTDVADAEYEKYAAAMKLPTTRK
jgi:hypothetical protein